MAETYMLIIPGVKLASAVVIELLTEREGFTVEPSPTHDEVWHLWNLSEAGRDKVIAVVQAMG